LELQFQTYFDMVNFEKSKKNYYLILWSVIRVANTSFYLQ